MTRAYDLEPNGRDDRLFTCLCVMAACQTDAVRCTLIEDDHARRANRLPAGGVFGAGGERLLLKTP